MSDPDVYPKRNLSIELWGLKCYFATVVCLVGILTMYQSTTNTDAPFVVG
jgi:hypothetical protein